MLLLGLLIVVKTSLANNDTLCSNLWSAMNTMQNGIDITSFDLFGSNPGWSQLPILKYTCNKGITWTNSINKVTYSIPDQFAQQPISIPNDVTLSTYHQTTNTKSEKMWMAESITESYAFGMFSKTKTLSESYQVIASDARLWGSINSSVSSFRVNLIPYQIAPELIQLSDNAANYIYSTIKNQGPIFNASTIQLYEQFFEYFGTHFFSTAYTGGVFHLRYETDKYLLYQMSEQQISEQGQASFFNFLVKSGAVSGGQKQIDVRYASMTTIIETCLGGSFCPTNTADYDNWQISVASTPWILSARFIPMHVLIYNDTQMSNSFDQAIFNHVQVSYLKNEILPNIPAVQTKIKHAINTSATYGETVSCQYPNYNPNAITNQCRQNSGDDCNAGDNYKAMFQNKNEYHGYVNNSLSQFYNRLLSAQQKLTQQLDVIEEHTNTLLTSTIIMNQTLFNVTANMWETMMQSLETNIAWDVCRWVNVDNCADFLDVECIVEPCGSWGPCHGDVTLNVSYFTGLLTLM